MDEPMLWIRQHRALKFVPLAIVFLAFSALASSQAVPRGRYPVQLSYNHSGTQIASSGDRFLTIWDAATESLILDIPVGDLYIENHAWSPDDTRIATVSGSNKVYVWHVSGTNAGTLETEFTLGSGLGTAEVRSVGWSSDGAILAAGWVYNGSLTLLGGSTYTHIKTISTSGSSQLEWNPDEARSLVAISDDEEQGVVIVDIDGLEVPIGLPSPARSIAWSPDGDNLGIGYENGVVQVWDIDSNTLIWEDTSAEDMVIRSLSWSHDGLTLATANGRGAVSIHDGLTGTLLQRTANFTAVVLDYSPTSDQLASGRFSDSITVVNSGTVPVPFPTLTPTPQP